METSNERLNENNDDQTPIENHQDDTTKEILVYDDDDDLLSNMFTFTFFLYLRELLSFH